MNPCTKRVGEISCGAAMLALVGGVTSCFSVNGPNPPLGGLGGLGGDSAAEASSASEGGDASTSDAAPLQDGTSATDGPADGAGDGAGSPDASNPPDAQGDAGASDGGGDAGAFCAHPVPLSDGVGSTLEDMFVDDTAVYWYEGSVTLADGGYAARVSKVPVGGGPTVVLFESAPCDVSMSANMASNGTTLYIDCRQVLDSTRTVQIMQIPKDGSTPTPLFISHSTVAFLDVSAGTLGADDTNVYAQVGGGNGPIYKFPVDGGAPVAVTPVPGDPNWFIFGAYNIVPVGSTLYIRGLANMTGALFSVPISGGVPALLASDATLTGTITNLVAHGGSLYWRDATIPLGVWQLPLAGGTPTALATYPGLSNAMGQLALFGSDLYFAGYYSGDLRLESVPLGQTDGGPPTVLEDFPPSTDYAPVGGGNLVVANGSHVFFADPGNPGGGKVYRCD